MLIATFIFLFTCYGIILPTPIGVMSLSDICLVMASLYTLLAMRVSVKSTFDIGLMILLIWYLALMPILALSRADFDGFGHLINYLRILALGALILSPIFKRWIASDLARILRYLKIATIIHSLAVLVDVVLPMPLEFGEYTYIQLSYYHRPRGLFGEPSYAAIYLLMALSLNMLYGRKFERWHAIPIVSIVATTSLIGIFGLICLAAPRILNFQMKNAFYIIATVSFISLGVASTPVFKNQIVNRLENISTDSSGMKRIVGAYIAADFVIRNHPFTGVGLGGGNFDGFFGHHPGTLVYASQSDYQCTISGTCDALLMPTSANMFVMLLASGGLVSLAIYSVFIASLLNRRVPIPHRIFILFLFFSKGQAFEPFLVIYLYFIFNWAKVNVGICNINDKGKKFLGERAEIPQAR